MAMATINPATGETEFEAELHTPAEVETRIALAQTAHETLTSNELRRARRLDDQSR